MPSALNQISSVKELHENTFYYLDNKSKTMHIFLYEK